MKEESDEDEGGFFCCFQLQNQSIQEKGMQLFPCLLSHITIINSKKEC